MFRHSTLISLLIALHCLTYGRYMYGDIGVYNIRFGAGLGWEESPGLDFVFTLLHKFTNDIDWLVFVIVFASVFVTLQAYKLSKDSKPSTILMMFFTLYFVSYCLGNMKQAPAAAFCYLAVVSLIEKKWIISVLSFLIAIQFHESAYIIFVVPLLMIKPKNLFLNALRFIAVFTVAIAFPYVFSISFRALNGLSMQEQLLTYATSEGMLERDSTIMVIFKGAPYYYLTIRGFLNKNRSQTSNEHYEIYLWITAITSVLYFTSIFSYWMQRMEAIFFLPVAIFFTILTDTDNTRRNANDRYIVLAMFFIILMNFLLKWYPLL